MGSIVRFFPNRLVGQRAGVSFKFSPSDSVLTIFRQVLESFRFAWQALRSNLLRTTLSLLGVTIGIFAIIAVFTIVDSMQRSIKESLGSLGTNVVYIQKW